MPTPPVRAAHAATKQRPLHGRIPVSRAGRCAKTTPRGNNALRRWTLAHAPAQR